MVEENKNLIDILILEKTSIHRKQYVLDYLKEHVDYNLELNGSGSLDRILDKMCNEEFFIELEKG